MQGMEQKQVQLELLSESKEQNQEEAKNDDGPGGGEQGQDLDDLAR
jgi:hypothetical protein